MEVLMADSFSYLLPPLSEQVLRALSPLQGPLDEASAAHALTNCLPIYVASGRPIASLREYIGDAHPPGAVERAARLYVTCRPLIADGLRSGIAHCSLLEVGHLSRGDKDLAMASRQLKKMLEAELAALNEAKQETNSDKRPPGSWTDSASVRERAASQPSSSAYDLVRRNMEELDASGA